MEKTVTIVPQTPSLPQRERVCAYARVSLAKDAMLHSLAAQVDYYSKLIQANPMWIYAGVYADSGITGTKDDRPEFQRMIEDCRAGLIDRILVKSISRFARNTVTLLETVRMLRSLNIDIYFEEQNIHTLSGDGELMLSILASFAQEESRSVSENCLWRIQKKFENGETTGYRIYGFRYNAGSLEIVPEEAEMVRRIFSLYLDGLGKESIARELNADHVPSPCGVKWQPNVIQGILTNEKYAGNMLLQKTYTDNHLSKRKMKNNGEKPQFFVEEAHEAIITPAVFMQVQEEMKKRAEQFTHSPSRPISPFAGLIICGVCGKPFNRKKQHGHYFWLCHDYVHRAKEPCRSRRITERALRPILCGVLGVDDQGLESAVYRIERIVVFPDGRLMVTADGETIERLWENPSRSSSWTPEMRSKAAEDGKRGARLSCSVSMSDNSKTAAVPGSCPVVSDVTSTPMIDGIENSESRYTK